MSIPKAVGIETEYGILVWGAQEFNPFRASQLVLNAYQSIGGPSIPMGLYYNVQTGSVDDEEPSGEHGTPASETADDDTEEVLIALDEDQSEVEIIDSGSEPESAGDDGKTASATTTVLYGLGSLMLANGARFYIDHAHPEYCTPESLSPRLVVAADKAGERIVARCMDAANQNGTLPEGQRVMIFKNNSDQKGNSYGCHENYLLSVDLFEDLLRRRSHLIFRYLLPFLVSRLVVTGSGKVGYENKTAPATYQLSQRADFFEMLIGLQTTYRRPLFNTRDESHTDKHTFRRLHVILGDANMAEFSTYLKVGTTQLVLHMIEDGFIKTDLTLRDPLHAFQHVSRDVTFSTPLELENGQHMTAVEIQAVYLELAEQYLEQHDGTEEQWELWDHWADVIEALESGNHQSLARKLDWAIKRNVLDRYLQAQESGWEEVERWQRVIEVAVRSTNPTISEAIAQDAGLSPDEFARQREIYFTLRRLDLEYHDIHHSGPNAGLFYRLQNAGHVDRLLTDAEIDARLHQPPPDTRAWLRGKIVERFAQQIIGADWSYIKLFAGTERSMLYQLEFPNPLVGTEADLSAVWERLRSPEEVFSYFRTGEID